MDVKILIIFIVLIIVGYISYKYNEHFELTPTPSPSASPSPSPSASPPQPDVITPPPPDVITPPPIIIPTIQEVPTVAPFITLSPELSSGLLTDTDTSTLETIINEFDITSAGPYFENSTLKATYDDLIRKNNKMNYSITNDTRNYQNSYDKYGSLIKQLEGELSQLSNSLTSKEKFTNTNVDSEVNYDNTSDYKAFKEIYVN